MSLKISGNKFHNHDFTIRLELSDSILSFKELFGYTGIKDIYSGKEEIPFREKHIEFQKILLSEFII